MTTRFFRVYYKTLGGHTYTRWYAGGSPNPNVVMGKCGELVFVNDEWEALCEILRHSTVSILEDKRP